MRIRVTREFGGRITREQRIYPGEYEVTDPALFGVGQYLLDNGFAHTLGNPPEDAPVAPPQVVDTIEFGGRTIERFAPEGAFDAPGKTADVLQDVGWVMDVSGEVEAVDYSDLTIAELKDLLDERGVDYSDARRKDDYIALAQAQG